MKRLSPELKVGIFAIVVILVLSYMTFKVGTLPLTWKKGYRLYVVFDDISGLDEKSRIKIAGVDAGVVERIRLENGKARLTLFIEPDVKIYRNAKASLKMTGLLGDKYLTLTTGTPDEPLLRDGDTIINVEPAADIDSLASELTSAATYIGDLAKTLREIFGEPEKRAMRDAIHNLNTITQDLKELLKENREPLHRVLVSLERFSEVLDEKGPEFIENLNVMAKNLRDKAPGLIEELREAARELKEVIEENRYALKESIENVRKASASAGNIVQRIEKGEGTLGKLLKDEKLYESLSEVAEKVDKTLDVVDRLRTFMDFHTEYNTSEGEWKGYFDLTLQPKKDKYYILGVVTDPRGSVETIETTKDGVTTKEEKVKSRIEFTAQFAKRFEDLTLRIGMMESTFGVGADYFFHDDKGRVKVDVWDFSAHETKAKRAHAKIGVDYRIFKYIFISGGIDNLLNENRRGIYIGGGLKFEDEDFKYLFGRSPDISLP
jgi:phospholipid/cholesterol/gamma-HCH transport system substrate-binding protein